MQPEVEIVYAPEYRDFVRGFFWWYLHKYWLFYAFMLFLSVVFLFSPIITGELISSVVGILSAVAAAAVTLYAIFPSAKESVDQINKAPTRLVVTSEGLSEPDEAESTRVPWSFYRNVLETKSEFILMANDRMLPLPKRFFCEDKLRVFRVIVQRAFGSKAKLKQ